MSHLGYLASFVTMVTRLGRLLCGEGLRGRRRDLGAVLIQIFLAKSTFFLKTLDCSLKWIQDSFSGNVDLSLLLFINLTAAGIHITYLD